MNTILSLGKLDTNVLPSMTYFDVLLMWQASYFLCHESLESTKDKASMLIFGYSF